MDDAIRQLVVRRANNRCEYCHLPQSGHDERFSIDHIIALKHGGKTTLENVALSCLRCNLHKGTNLSGIDPVSSAIVNLFHPRSNNWREHFSLIGPMLTGLTPAGRATIEVLKMNASERVRLRQALISESIFEA